MAQAAVVRFLKQWYWATLRRQGNTCRLKRAKWDWRTRVWDSESETSFVYTGETCKEENNFFSSIVLWLWHMSQNGKAHCWPSTACKDFTPLLWFYSSKVALGRATLCNAKPVQKECKTHGTRENNQEKFWFWHSVGRLSWVLFLIPRAHLFMSS